MAGPTAAQMTAAFEGLGITAADLIPGTGNARLDGKVVRLSTAAGKRAWDLDTGKEVDGPKPAAPPKEGGVSEVLVRGIVAEAVEAAMADLDIPAIQKSAGNAVDAAKSEIQNALDNSLARIRAAEEVIEKGGESLRLESEAAQKALTDGLTAALTQIKDASKKGDK